MVNLKGALPFAMILPALILIGCEGQNTFQRNTNPVKNYQGAIEKSQPWKPGMGKRPPVVDADNRAFYCKTSYQLKITGESSPGHLAFREGVETAFEIQILSKDSNVEFTVSAENGPKQLKLNKLPDPSKRQLVWKPTAEDGRNESVKIVVADKDPEAGCDFAFAQVLNLDVDPGPKAPVVSVSGIPTEVIPYGEGREFRVQIVDPAATSDKAPVIVSLVPDQRMLQNAEAKIPNVSAVGAVDCGPGTLVTPTDVTKWQFACKILSSGLENVDNFLKHPQTVNVVFLIKAKSAASGLVATDRSGVVSVKFPELPKPEEKPIVAKIDQPTVLAGGAAPKLVVKPAKKPAPKARPKKETTKTREATKPAAQTAPPVVKHDEKAEKPAKKSTKSAKVEPKTAKSTKDNKTADKKTKPASPTKTDEPKTAEVGAV